MSHLRVYLSMPNRFTIDTERIMDVTLWISLVAVLCMLLKSEAAFNPATVTLQLDIPKIEESPTRNWVLQYPVTAEEFDCLALNVYFEARSESPEAQYAVAEVVLYRVMNVTFPNSICGVVKQAKYGSWKPNSPIKWQCQFSFYCDHKSDIPTEERAFEVAKFIANDILNNPAYMPVLGYALYYHAEYVNPYWAKTKTRVNKVGSHVFYL